MDEQANQIADTAERAAGGAVDSAASTMPSDITDVSGWAQYFQDNASLYTGYVVKIVGVLIVLFVAWVVAGWLAKIVAKGMRRARIEETLTRFAARSMRWAIMIFAALGCLGAFGVDVTSFAVVLGAAGLAIGLAFQGSLSNLAAGVMLLIFRPFKVGQFVLVAGQSGTIDEIGVFSTTMDTPDNRRLILPNSAVFGSVIENVTHHPIRRVDVAVGVAYDSDIDHTRQVLEEAAAEVHDPSTGKDPQVMLLTLGNSSVDWTVRAWVKTSDYWPKRDLLTETVKKYLDRADITIPFPQMDVHLDQPVAAGAT
ncbi:MAG: mechanosensitive ion channel [Phycisphaerales bacterium]|nr:MAG: mechanosensitive ion channel [Phycisphaerales bacterium]